MSPRFFYANEEAETELVWVSEIEIGLRRVEQEEVILFPDKKAAVLITRSQKHDHITLILTEQHRLFLFPPPKFRTVCAIASVRLKSFSI